MGDMVWVLCPLRAATKQYKVVLIGSLYSVMKHFHPHGSPLQNEIASIHRT